MKPHPDARVIHMSSHTAAIGGAIGAVGGAIANVAAPEPGMARAGLIGGLIGLLMAIGALAKDFWADRRDARRHAELRREFVAMRKLVRAMWAAVAENREWMRKASVRLPDLPLPEKFEHRVFDSADFLSPFLALEDSDYDLPTRRPEKDE